MDYDYDEFVIAVKEIMANATAPINVIKLLTILDGKCAIPTNMKEILLKNDIFFIPRCGYWSAPQFVLDTGQIVSKRMKSKRMERLMSLFEEYGWPIQGIDAMEWSNGLVSPRYLIHQAKAHQPKIHALGYGLYVPSTKAKDKMPMSLNVAKMVDRLKPDYLLKDKNDRRLFRLMNVFEQKKLATVKRSRSSINCESCQTMRVTLNKKGRFAVNSVLKTTVDTF